MILKSKNFWRMVNVVLFAVVCGGWYLSASNLMTRLQSPTSAALFNLGNIICFPDGFAHMLIWGMGSMNDPVFMTMSVVFSWLFWYGLARLIGFLAIKTWRMFSNAGGSASSNPTGEVEPKVP